MPRFDRVQEVEMPRRRTPIEIAAGKLVSAIQKEWGAELGTSPADVGEHVLGRAHGLLQAARAGTLDTVLGSTRVADFLGILWIKRHPDVLPAVLEFESLILREQDA
jgi:hypothetical protein